MVYRIPPMTDMKRTPKEKEEPIMGAALVAPSEPDYPWGLRITLGTEELEKLDMEGDCEVGDYLHMHCLAKVTSVSEDERGGKKECTVSLTITHMEAEDESSENDEAEEEMYGR